MRKIAVGLAGLLLLVGTACASNASGKSSAVQTVKVAEGDMFLKPSVTQLSAGKVTFEVTNNGKMHHEFVIVTGDPTGTTGDEEGRVSEAGHLGGEEGPEIGDIAPGQTKQLIAQLSPGTYTAMCNLPDHFAAGMHFTFTVA
jgi:uncharacterized cupredoxin-like copper-binding protein